MDVDNALNIISKHYNIDINIIKKCYQKQSKVQLI